MCGKLVTSKLALIMHVSQIKSWDVFKAQDKATACLSTAKAQRRKALDYFGSVHVFLS